jgi:DMSO/TMAO reductase YedYZ molybdopterin-dependent catalytic subunit
VGGLVDKPLELTLDELRAFPQVSQNSRMKCVQCWSSRATWGGFRFEHFLDRVKPAKTAKAIRIDCADKWYEYMSIEEMLSPRVLLTLDLEGKPLPDKHGAPLRLIDPAKYGYKSAKLITSIEFVAEGKGSMACDIGPYYSPDGAILAGYDHPLDLGPKVRKKIRGGEITEY